MATLSFEENPEEESNEASDIQNGGVILLPDSDVESDEEEEKKEEADSSSSTKKRKRDTKKDKKKKKKKHIRLPAPTPLPLKRHKIRLRNEFMVDESINLQIREFTNMDCDGAVLVEGFPSKGLSSVMAANFLIKSLDLPLVGEVYSRAFPTVGRVTSYQPSNPIRIYGDRRVVVFVSEVVLEEPQVCWTMAEAIYDFGNRHRCSLLITLESVMKTLEIELNTADISQESIFEMISARMTGRTQEEKEEAAKTVYEIAKSPKNVSKSGVTISTPPPADPAAKKQKTEEGDKNKEKKEVPQDVDEILFFSNDNELAEKARKLGGVPTKNVIVGGVTGCLIAESHTRDIPVICLISHHSALNSDDRAALNCLTFVGKIAEQLKIDVEPLKKKAASYEKQVKKALSEMAHGVKSRSKISNSMYM